jgi:hypothetical protein
MLVLLSVAACEVTRNLRKETFAEVKAGKFVVIGGNNEELATLSDQGLTLRGPGANIILRNVDEKDLPPQSVDNPEFQPYIALIGRNEIIKLDVGMPGREFGPFLSIQQDKKIIWEAP